MTWRDIHAVTPVVGPDASLLAWQTIASYNAQSTGVALPR